MVATAPAIDERDLIRRIRAEYREMPGLSLTLPQAARLWQIDSIDCGRLLERLTDAGVLRLIHGRYLSSQAGL
jgi:hypothetical protein